MSLQTQQLGLCRNHGPIFGKENSNRFEAKNSKNMELIKNLEGKKKSWTLWGGAPNQDSLRIMFFVCFVVFVFFVFFLCLWFLFFQSVWGFSQFRRNLAAASKPIRTMNIQKRRSIRVQYLMNYKAICVAKLHFGGLPFCYLSGTEGLYLALFHWRKSTAFDIMHFRHKSGAQSSANGCCLHSPNLLCSEFPGIDCVLKWRSRGVAWSTHASANKTHCHFRPSAHCNSLRTSACDERIAIYHRSTCVSQCTWTSFTAPPHPMMNLAHQ